MSAVETEPIVAGFDAGGDWHDGGNGRYARPGWSSAKALALRAIRGAFARDAAKAATKMGEWNRESRSWDPYTHVPVWLEAADDYLSRLGVAKGHAVKVTYLDDTYGAIDAVHPDGTTRPVKVKWERFADHLPSRGAFNKQTLVKDLDSDLPWHQRSQSEAFVKAAFEHDLGDVYTTASVSGGVLNGEGATVNVEVYRASDRKQIGRAWYELRLGNGVEAHIQTAMVTTQGKGIGTRFTRAIEEGLAANGVSRVTLDAMTDKSVSTGKRTANGAYSWARAGFGWANYNDGRKIGRMMLELDPGNEVGRRLIDAKFGPNFPTPNDVATDPIGRRVLLWDHDLGNPGWSGVKPLDRAWPKAAPRVDTPEVRRNTTKADRGVGQATAARIRDAGGTGQAVVADGYLARHGHPKGSTATVTYVDDVYADVHPTTPDGRTVRSKWSHFSDAAPEPEPSEPSRVDAPEFSHDLGGGYRSVVLSKDDNPNGSYSINGAFIKDGEQFGEFSAGVYPNQRSLAWGWVGLPPEHQRSGIGSRFMAATEGAFYRGGVIDHAVLTADSGRAANPADTSVGAYVMAKAGYQWRNADAALDVGEAMLELDDSSALAQRLVSGDGWGKDGFPTPADVAADPVGSEALMDVQWEGTKKLADDAPQQPDHDPLRAPNGYVLEPDDRDEETPPEMLAVTPEREAAIRAATWHHGTINPDWMSNDGWTHVGSLAAAEHRAAPRDPGDVDYDPTGKPSAVYDVRLKPDARIAPVMTEDWGEITWDTPTGPYDVVPYWNVAEDPGSMSLLVRPGALERVDGGGNVPEPAGLGPRPASGTYEWDLDATAALSAGDVSIDDLRALGANDATLHTIASTVSQGHATIEAPTFGWQPLPDTLWHATTDADAVARDGLRTRSEIGGVGAGGQSNRTISLASDLDHAQAVARGVLEARAAAVGDTTLADMVARAATGDGGSKPFLNDPNGLLIHLQVVTGLGSDWKPGDPIPADLDTPEARVDAWRQFAFIRDRAGGPRDPLILADADRLAAIDPAQVKVLRVEPASDRARGIELDRLGETAADRGEWRVASGSAVRVAETLDAEPPPAPSEPTVALNPSPFDPERYADREILDWLAKPGLDFAESEAMDLHSAKLTWLFEEGIRRGWNHDQARKATQAIDGALDRSSETLGWTRELLVEAVDRVDSGRVETDLDRGVVVQRAFTDAVWQAIYGDAPSIEVSRIVSHDDPDRSMPGMPVDGVSSWVVRSNEQQVIDWFAYRDLTPEVIRSDIDRDRVLMLPWGEGRYRSDYVRIKGEVLVGPDRTPSADARGVLLDPDAERDTVGRAVFAGKVGGVNVVVDKVQVNTSTSGPDHLPRTVRKVGALLHATINGVDHEMYVNAEIAPGVDGDPHIEISPHGDYDAVFEPYLDDLAERVGADTLKAHTPGGQSVWGNERMRQFIEAGWGWHPAMDRQAVRWFGEDLAYDHGDNPLVQAWKNWDKVDFAAIPAPQAILDPENISLRSDALARIWLTGVKDRTGRVAVPRLPNEGSGIDWADVTALPDGTHLSRDSKQFIVSGGKVYPADDRRDAAAYPPNPILPPGDWPPGQMTVVRYRSPDIPQVPDPPDPYPGIAVRGKVTPVHPYVYRGQVIDNDGIARLPEGTRVRQVLVPTLWEDDQSPAPADPEGHEWVLGPNGTMSAAHNHMQSRRVPSSGDELWVVTAPPADNAAPTPTPDEHQQRLRAMLIDETRRHKIPKNGIATVAPFAVGAMDPADWNANRDDLRPVTRVLVAGALDWRKETWPPVASYETTSMFGTEAVGPLWRIPSVGATRTAMYSTTPIDGVEPETLAAGAVNGALRDDTGWVLWAPAYTPVPWRDPQPSPLTDDEVAERTARIGTPPGLIDVTGEIGSKFGPSQVGAWLHDSRRSGAYRIDIPGERSVTGPVRTVVIGQPLIDRRNGKPYSIGWFPYPIGSPEAIAAGIDPNDPNRVVLPIDDPRLRGALDAAWWARALDDGTVDRIEQGLIAENPRHIRRGISIHDPDPEAIEAIKPWDSVEAKIEKYLHQRSQELRAAVSDADGMIGVKRNGDRFVVTPGGAKVPATTIPYLTVDGDTTIAHLNYDGLVAALGDAVRPDYTPVFDTEQPWDERVAHLVAQRDKVVSMMPGGGRLLAAAFAPPETTLDGRLWTAPTRSDVEHMRRARAVAEYGAAVDQLMAERVVRIRADASRDGTYIDPEFPSAVMTPLLPNHAKSMRQAVAKIADDLSPAPWERHGSVPDPPAFRENPTVIDMLDRLARGDVHIKYRPPTEIAAPTDTAARASLGSIMISANIPSNVDRRRGPYVEFRIGANGTIAEAKVHADGTSSTLDAVTYVTPEAWLAPGDTPPPAADIAGRKRLGKRLMKLAEDIGMVSKADPRPTLAEIAFLETMEAMGIDMGINPNIEVGGAPASTRAGLVKLGRSTSPEAYAAKIGLNLYPRDWTDHLLDKPQRVDFSDEAKFTLSGGGWNRLGGQLIKLADPRLHPQHRSSVVHEFGHSIERAIPGISAAEAWYLAARLAAGARESIHDDGETGYTTGDRIKLYRDGFAWGYTGRVYNGSSIGGNDAYEIFTTGAEALIGTNGRVAADDDLRRWIAGLMALFRPVTLKP